MSHDWQAEAPDARSDQLALARDRRPPQSRAGASIVRIAAWISLLLGVGSSVNAFDGALVLTAATSGGAFVVATSLFRPENYARQKVTFHVIALMGAVLTVAAVTLTGGLGSPFLLLALMPSLFAAMVGGFGIGLVTALLSTALITGVAVTTEGVASLLPAAGTIGLFPLVALVVAQIRSLLADAEARAHSLAEATEAAESELLFLGQANELLRRLTDLYGEGSTNPVAVGRRAIEAIVEAYPGSFATATLFDTQGPVVVARAGTDAPALVRQQFPLSVGDTTSGVVSIATRQPMTSQNIEEIERLLRPVSVSFVNALLLQQIAGEAVREERLRLARELHDEVGPALAALGLSLDGVVMQGARPGSEGEIQRIREGLGDVVNDLRGIIADLRSDPARSLTGEIRSSVAEYAAPPTIDIDIDERGVPHGSTRRHISAVVIEAVRNAYRHADANTVRVHGSVDTNAVDLEVVDDGHGFDPVHLPEGHFGVMGMRERADSIGGRLEVHSDASGTRVRISWKEDR